MIILVLSVKHTTIHCATCCTIVLHSNRQEFYSMQHVAPKRSKENHFHLATCCTVYLSLYTCACIIKETSIIILNSFEVHYREVPYREVPYREVPYREVPYREVHYREVPYREVPYREVPYREVPLSLISSIGLHLQYMCSSILLVFSIY